MKPPKGWQLNNKILPLIYNLVLIKMKGHLFIKRMLKNTVISRDYFDKYDIKFF